MKKVFLLSLSFWALFPIILLAQENKKEVKEWMHAKLYLKNNSIVEGYLVNSFAIGGYAVTRYINEPCSSDSVMKLSDLKGLIRKNEKYSNHDIDSMITWKDQDPQFRFKWEPQMVIFSYGNNDPIIEDHLIMLRVVYRGKNVTGYIINHLYFGYKCLYKTSEMSCAKAFLNVEHKFSEKRRKTLLEEFGSYPGMKEYIKGLDKKDVKDNPFAILEILDDAIEKQK